MYKILWVDYCLIIFFVKNMVGFDYKVKEFEFYKVSIRKWIKFLLEGNNFF